MRENGADEEAVTVAVSTIRTQVTLPLRFADGYATTARVYSFEGLVDGREHLAFGLGDRALPVSAHAGDTASLVRPHSECLTGDVFGSQRCDYGPKLREAVEKIAGVGGFLLYLRQEGRGIGLYAKLDAYALQDAGLYTVAAQMLTAPGSTRMAVLSNNPGQGQPARTHRYDDHRARSHRRTPVLRERQLPGHESPAVIAHDRRSAVGDARGVVGRRRGGSPAVGRGMSRIRHPTCVPVFAIR